MSIMVALAFPQSADLHCLVQSSKGLHNNSGKCTAPNPILESGESEGLTINQKRHNKYVFNLQDWQNYLVLFCYSTNRDRRSLAVIAHLILVSCFEWYHHAQHNIKFLGGHAQQFMHLGLYSELRYLMPFI